MAAPFVGIELGCAATFLGETLTRVLESSKLGARATDAATQKMPLLDLSRSRTWTSFIRGTACCDIEKDDDGVRLYASRYAIQKPLVPRERPTLTLPTEPLAIELGAALLAAFRAVEPKRSRRTAA